MDALLQTWETNHRINEYLLSGIKEEHLNDVAATKGRTVGKQFAHIHNVRVMWIEVAVSDRKSEVQKIDADGVVSKKILLDAFAKSTPLITDILRKGLETGKVKGFKPSPEAFLGYLIAHEAHHRSQAILILKENKHMPDKKILYGMWEWGVR